MAICTSFSDPTPGRLTVHTSGARPVGSARHEGKVIWESDIDTTELWDSYDWAVINEPTNDYVVGFTNVTVGNGTTIGKFHRSDGFIDAYVKFTLGSTSAVTGNIEISMPRIMTSGLTISSSVQFIDASPLTVYMGGTHNVGTNTIRLFSAQASASASLPFLATSATAPFTWAVSDSFEVYVRYKMDTRYL